MAKYTEKVEKLTLPTVILSGLIAFPSIPMSFEVSDEVSADSCARAEKRDGTVFLVARRDENGNTPDNLYGVGTVVKIKQQIKLPEGNTRLFVEGLCRASVVSFGFEDGHLDAELICKTVTVEQNGGIRGEALVHEIIKMFDEFVTYLPKMSNEMTVAVRMISHPGLLADFIACNVLINFADKQRILEQFDPMKRAELLAVIMERERDILVTEARIHKRVRSQIETNQREYYLREQLKAIREELGDEDDADGELDEYYERIEAAKLPTEIEEKLVKEVKKLSKSPYSSAESGVIRNYLDLCLELPWTKLSRDRLNVEAARKVLERDHDGLEKIKQRILEFIAVRQLNPDLKNQILCLVGPPGTGKTSVGASIARALNRKYVRVSLGGVRDEADIRGHRRTYIGSMPGRIINALRQAKVRNPLILLDEIDKLTNDAHGDPSSALLEVLDSEQNRAFCDHFVELPIDLSDCIFIATANTLETVSRPLIDRMEIIEMKIYTRHEKLSIARHHLIPKQLKRHGLNARLLKFTDAALFEIIDYYTNEAGVRNLERELAAVCRKAAMKYVSGEKPGVIDADGVAAYLGIRKIIPEGIYAQDEIGLVNGLAYTELGGDMLRVEAAAMPGTGKIELTGSLGEVMKESARAAITYIRSHSDELGVDPEFYRTKDIHIHVPEGAVPKDGPSAGVTIVTALTSELSGRPVRRDVAMTGEITLRGRVLPIGGLKEKTMAAYKSGIKTVFIPADNLPDLEEIDPLARDSLKFVPCRKVGEVLSGALTAPDDNTGVTDL